MLARPRLRTLLGASITATMLVTALPAHAGAVAPSPLHDSFRAAAAATGVPVDVLEAMGWTTSHWQQVEGEDGSHGLMQLSDAQVARASALSGISTGRIRTEPAANIAAAAVLLAAARGAATSDPATWHAAISSVAGAALADEVDLTLARGVDASTRSGEHVVLPASSTVRAGAGVHPDAAAGLTDEPGVAWVPASSNNYDVANRPSDLPITTIVIHVTQGTYAGAIATFQNPSRQSSANYVIRSADGAITQMVREKDIAWHAGNYPVNQRSIGIEHEGFVSDPQWFTGAMYQSSAHLVADIVRRYGIIPDKAHIIGHNEVPDPYHPGLFGGDDHHTDPGPYWNWSGYMQTVAQLVGAPSAQIVAGTNAVSPSTSFSVAWSRAANSSGAAYYVIWSRDGNGAWLPWLTHALGTSATFYGRAGHQYSFYAQAVNNVGAQPGPTGAQWTRAVSSSATSSLPFKGLYSVDAYGRVGTGDTPPQWSASGWGFQIARGIVTRSTGDGGYVLDGWGGVHAYGDAPGVAPGAYWPGWDIARGIALRPNGTSGYVLDGYGGLHPFGGAPAVQVSAYWPGWDIARAVVLRPDGVSGYVLDGYGGLHPFGGAPGLATTGYWPYWDIAHAITLNAAGTGGYVLDGWGGLHAFGSATPVQVSAYWPGWDIARGVVMVADPSHAGVPSGYTLDGYGGYHEFGNAPTVPASAYWAGQDTARGIAAG